MEKNIIMKIWYVEKHWVHTFHQGAEEELFPFHLQGEGVAAFVLLLLLLLLLKMIPNDRKKTKESISYSFPGQLLPLLLPLLPINNLTHHTNNHLYFQINQSIHLYHCYILSYFYNTNRRWSILFWRWYKPPIGGGGGAREPGPGGGGGGGAPLFRAVLTVVMMKAAVSGFSKSDFLIPALLNNILHSGGILRIYRKWIDR